MSTAVTRLLVRRWGLPDVAVPVVDRFLDAWAAGHTSIDIRPDEVALLTSCPAVSDGSRQAPLVIRGSRLQSWRLDQAEARVARRLRRLVTEEPTGDAIELEEMDALFPDGASAQRRVAGASLRQKCVLVTGGPGTGKTTVAGRVLALLASRKADLRIALAAPTGKAAVRLGEAIGGAVSGLASRFVEVASRLEVAAGEACTLHRLLGWQPRTGRCLFHAGNPLPYDVIVVDEASMLDLMLWDRLLEAIASETRLVMLGDHRQLASVEPGRVLGELVVAADEGLLGDAHVDLEQNYRFDADAAIGRLADAVRNHDGDLALEVLTDADAPGDAVQYCAAALDEAVDAIWPHVLDVIRSRTPEAALEALARVRILCALNEGPYGATGLNARIENRLQQAGVVVGSSAHGRPVIVRVNDRQHSGLVNGDVGVVLRGFGSHESGVYFQTPGTGQTRRVAVEAMPQHDTAWALTVHRAQGSEFDAVVLVLPPMAHELVTPELLYTGVTRARARVLVVADDGAIRAACQRRESRRSGLSEKLRSLLDLN